MGCEADKHGRNKEAQTSERLPDVCQFDNRTGHHEADSDWSSSRTGGYGHRRATYSRNHLMRMVKTLLNDLKKSTNGLPAFPATPAARPNITAVKIKP